MSRLLFAAARGARIQGEICGKWMTTRGICPDVDRIHPDDEYLQYGPISSALRDAAHDVPEWVQDVSIWVTTAVEEVADGELGPLWSFWRHTGELHRSLFLLLLAEALADEGL